MLGTKTITRMEADYLLLTRRMSSLEIGTLLRRAQATKDIQDAKVALLEKIHIEKMRNDLLHDHNSR